MAERISGSRTLDEYMRLDIRLDYVPECRLTKTNYVKLLNIACSLPTAHGTMTLVCERFLHTTVVCSWTSIA